MGHPAAAAGVAQQAAARSHQWRHPHPGARARGQASPGAGLPAVGLVRRRIEGRMAMTRRLALAAASTVWLLAVLAQYPMAAQAQQAAAAHAAVSFETSDSCLACHNGLTTP